MTTIDHRILIPAAPDVVWEFISDISRNPDWQVDCHEVIFLTSRREGPGLRWRYSGDGGDRVVAVTAWYNGLGYEYYFVDGTPFRDNKGRIRLQEIPEGTIVQWTFHYELGGLLGGMRNTLGVSRQVDHTIADSLKKLWQRMKQSGATAQSHEAKSLMRDAPDVNARSAYQPRHPTVQTEPTSKPVPAKFEPPISEDDGQPIHVIDEPPIAEDDTRPRRPVEPGVPTPAPVVPDEEGEPEFLSQIDLSRFEPPRDPSDTQPRKPVAEEAAPPAVEQVEQVAEIEAPPVGLETEPLAEPLPEILPGYAPPLVTSEPEQPTAPAEEAEEATQIDVEAEAPITLSEPPTQPSVPITEADENTQIDVAAAAPVTPDEPPPAPVTEVEAPPVEAPEAEPPVEPEAARIEPTLVSESASIWEIFGVPRPSDTKPMAAVNVEPSAEPAEAEAELLTPITLPRASTHVGLRIALRRRLIHVRRA